MFCDTAQVNQLTALLRAHAIRHVVVCPGSRNATIVHNLHCLPENFTLHAVTDERCAAFVALGLTLALQEAVAVCVTSGSALLNCLPAVAEAAFRHLPLLVVSADRPREWIGQLDGQTLEQVGALRPYCTTAGLVIPHTAADHHLNNLRINEALLSLKRKGGQPAHINVPIAEPMFSFTTPALPEERVIREYEPEHSAPLPEEVVRQIAEARWPALLIGQYERGDLRSEVQQLHDNGQLLVLSEILSDVRGYGYLDVLDDFAHTEGDKVPVPDLVIQIGGNFVHKRFKEVLRQASCSVIRIAPDDDLPDTFGHLTAKIRSSECRALGQLASALPYPHTGVTEAQRVYDKRLEAYTALHKEQDDSPYVYVLRRLRSALGHHVGESYSLHLANSTAVRAASLVFDAGEYPIHCNRGVNGIEGSVSTAVGYALGMWGLTILVIGDLSFFYDSNGLWNVALPPGLRILLLNDGHGGIFDRLPGLSHSAAQRFYVAAGGKYYSAEGIARSFETDYLSTGVTNGIDAALSRWLAPGKRARLLEVRLNDRL